MLVKLQAERASSCEFAEASPLEVLMVNRFVRATSSSIEVLTASLADSPKFHRPDAALRGCFLLALSAACTCAAKPCFLCTDWRSRISFRCLYYPQGSNCASLYGKLDPR
eukprot:TRINITY_DN10342_c0_g1_i2.p1 TRINITY_DN10342_c0_g1~~TRINITY_DN10342_c0_g1_i2.p1  ORF type:complete len:110 (-),score=8.07 TRINITY_DN10342_c0_g1_i2:323-652(-)